MNQRRLAACYHVVGEYSAQPPKTRRAIGLEPHRTDDERKGRFDGALDRAWPRSVGYCVARHLRWRKRAAAEREMSWPVRSGKLVLKNRAGPARGLLPHSRLGCRFFDHHGQLQPAFLSRILFGAQAFGLGGQFGKARWLLRV